MSDSMACPSCGNEVTEDSDFCPHCGILFPAAAHTMCDEHPANSALGVCIICGKVLCDLCGSSKDGRIFCAAHKNVRVEEDWAEVFRSTEISDAELVKAVLESAGKDVRVQNFNSIGFVWDGGGDSPISRSNINKPAKVFVPIPDFVEAASIIREWKQSAPDDLPDSSGSNEE
jgi:hypothetical protein